MKTLFTESFSEIEKVQTEMSFHDPYSLLNKVNQSPFCWIEVSDHLYDLLQKGWNLQMQSNGLFHLTSAHKLQVLGILPTHKNQFTDTNSQALTEYPPLLSFRKEVFTTRSTRYLVKLNRAVRLCVDGIAKGYAVDLAVRKLQEMGIQSGMINAGGDMIVFGDQTAKIVQKSLHNHQIPQLIELPTLHNQAMATSSQTEHFDPDHPGWIVHENGEAAKSATVSVFAKEAYLADALTKVFLLTPANCHKKLEENFAVKAYYNRTR